MIKNTRETRITKGLGMFASFQVSELTENNFIIPSFAPSDDKKLAGAIRAKNTQANGEAAPHFPLGLFCQAPDIFPILRITK
jgi:hypothetical protein